MRKIFFLILLIFFHFGFSQEKITLSSLASLLNKQNISLTGQIKQYKSLDNGFFLLPIVDFKDYDIYIPIDKDKLALKLTQQICSGGNVLLYYKKQKKYLAFSFFSGECIMKKDYKRFMIKFNLDTEYINYQSVLFDKSLKKEYYLNFYPTLKRTDSLNFIKVQIPETKDSYQVDLDKRFYDIPLSDLITLILMKDQNIKNEENDTIIDEIFFPFMK